MGTKPHLSPGVRITQAVLFLLGLFTGALAALVFTIRPLPWVDAIVFLIPPALCFGNVIAINQGLGLGGRRGRDAPGTVTPVETEEAPQDQTVWPPSPRRR